MKILLILLLLFGLLLIFGCLPTPRQLRRELWHSVTFIDNGYIIDAFDVSNSLLHPNKEWRCEYFFKQAHFAGDVVVVKRRQWRWLMAQFGVYPDKEDARDRDWVDKDLTEMK